MKNKEVTKEFLIFWVLPILAGIVIAVQPFLIHTLCVQIKQNKRNLDKDKYGFVEIYDSDKLSTDILNNRNGKLIIERVIGVVLDEKTGEGKVLDPCDEGYDFISYAGVEDAEQNDTILTYLVYDPDSDYTDDVIMRFDYIIGKKGDHKVYEARVN